MKELFQFLFQKKKFWLMPVVLILLIIGFVIVTASGSALSPFIYTLF